MRYILLALITICLSSSADSYRPWPNTELVLKEVCEAGRKTYGVNEYIRDGKVCRMELVCCKDTIKK
jgi:hypothetical protein